VQRLLPKPRGGGSRRPDGNPASAGLSFYSDWLVSHDAPGYWSIAEAVVSPKSRPPTERSCEKHEPLAPATRYIRATRDPLIVSSYVVGSFIGGGFVLVGAALAMVRETFTRKAERRLAHATELGNAMREYLAALDAIAIESEDMPEQPAITRIDRWLDRQSRRFGLDVLVHIIVRILRRTAYGRRHDELFDRVVLAATQLRLIASPAVLVTMRDIEAVTKRAGPTGQYWNREWMAIRDQVRDEFRKELASAGASPAIRERLAELRRNEAEAG
jgi:hypothetical protein